MNFGDIISSISKYVPSLGARRPKREKEMAADVRPKPLGTPTQSAPAHQTAFSAPTQPQTRSAPAHEQAPVFSAPAMPPTPFDDGEAITPFKPFDRATLDLRVKKAWAGFKAAYPDVEPSPGVLMAVASHPKIPTAGIHNAFPIEAREAMTALSPRQVDEQMQRWGLEEDIHDPWRQNPAAKWAGMPEQELLRQAVYTNYGLSDAAREAFEKYDIRTLARGEVTPSRGGPGASPAAAYTDTWRKDQARITVGDDGKMGGKYDTNTLYHEFLHGWAWDNIDLDAFMKDLSKEVSKDKTNQLLSGIYQQYADDAPHAYIALAQDFSINKELIPKSMHKYVTSLYDEKRVAEIEESQDHKDWKWLQSRSPVQLKEDFEAEPDVKLEYDRLKKKFEPGTLGKIGGSLLGLAETMAEPWQRVLTTPYLSGPAGVAGALATGKNPLEGPKLEDMPGDISAVAQVGLDIGAGALAKAPGLAGKVARPLLKGAAIGATGISAADLYKQYNEGELGAEDTAQALLTGIGTIYTASEVSKLSKSVLSKIGNTELGQQLSAKLAEEVGGVRVPGGQDSMVDISAKAGYGKGEAVKPRVVERMEERARQLEIIGPDDAFDDIPLYQRQNFVESARVGKELFDADQKVAWEVAMGRQTAPAGLDPTWIHIAAEEQALEVGLKDPAKGFKMLNELAHSPLVAEKSRAGATIAAERYRLSTSPTKIIQETEEKLAEGVKGRSWRPKEKEVSKVATDIQQEVEKAVSKAPATKIIAEDVVAKILKKAEKEKPKTEDWLARRVISHTKAALEPNVKELSEEALEAKKVQELVKELYNVAKPTLPEVGKKAAPEPTMNVVRRMFDQSDEAQRVYAAAKDQVLDKFKDKPKILEALEAYEASQLKMANMEAQSPFPVPLSGKTISKAVKEELKAKSVVLREIVAGHTQEQQADIAAGIADSMVKNGFTPEAANAFSALAEREIRGRMGAAKATALRQMADTFGKKINKPTFEEKITKLTNLGALESDDYLDLARAKLGIEVTTEQGKELVKLTNAVQEAGSDNEAYGYALADLEDYVSALRKPRSVMTAREHLGDITGEEVAGAIIKHPLRTVGKAADLAKAVKATWDDSFVGRQGRKLMTSNPKKWAQLTLKSFKDIANTFGGKEVMRETRARAFASPDYRNGTYRKMGLDLNVREEDIPVAFQEKIPGIGRLFKAADVAYSSFATEARRFTADQLLAVGRATGDNMDGEWLKAAGKYANVMGGRGSLGKAEPMAGFLNKALFSPRNLAGHGQFFTMGLDPRVPSTVRKMAAKNALQWALGTAAILTTAKALGADVEIDPRSANAGSIRIGSRRIDVTGGAKTLVSLTARTMAWLASYADEDIGIYKDSQTDEMTTRADQGFGVRTGEDVVIDFMKNKSAPAGTVVMDILRGKDFTNQPITLPGEIRNLGVPIITELPGELESTPGEGNIALMMILEGLGFGVQNYIAPDNPLIKLDKEFQEDTADWSAQDKFNARFQWRDEIKSELDRLSDQKNKKAATGWSEFRALLDERNEDLRADNISPDGDKFPKELWDTELEKLMKQYPVFARQYKQIPQKLLLR